MQINEIKQGRTAAALDKVQTWSELKELIAELAAENRKLKSLLEAKEGGTNAN